MHKNAQRKFPETAHGCSMAKIAYFNDAFLEIFGRQASFVEGQSLQQKDKKL